MGKSMSLQEDSRASLFHQSEREEEKMMTVISGRRCYELYMKYGHGGVVCENVAGILTMLQPGIGVEMGSENDIFGENHILRSEQRYTIDEICEDIENEGYTVQAFVIPACAVGCAA